MRALSTSSATSLSRWNSATSAAITCWGSGPLKLTMKSSMACSISVLSLT
uniref:Uncharacterized protein n=1 Tax=Arundo donax TaxID=35708 RepID=A0A0A8YDC1_ARUDO